MPEINRRYRLSSSKEDENSVSNNLLSWMMEIAEPDEADASSLAHLEVVLSLASIHTTQMNAVHCLYDLIAHREFLQPIRDEINQVLQEDGPWMSWEKSSFSKLRKLDSFMRESQRWNPPTLLSMHRVMLQDYTFTDGTSLRKGAHISMAVNAIQNDPITTPDPEIFDGLRYYKLRQRENEGHLHQFSTTQERVLNFGHGKYSCPGRFFASLEIKIVLVRLIMGFDFRFREGTGRPKNLVAHEFIFPNPDAELLMRARKGEDRLGL